jgi:hypothetical protein
MGQKYLVAGKQVSMRLWDLEPGGEVKHPSTVEELAMPKVARAPCNSR